MRTSTSRKSLNRRLVVASRVMAHVILALLVLYPLLVVTYSFVAPEMAALHAWTAGLEGIAVPLEPGAALCLSLGLLVAAAPGVWGLFHLRMLFLGYATGEVLTVDAAVRFNRFAQSLLVAAFAGPVGSAVTTLALSTAGWWQGGTVRVRVSTEEIGLAVLGGVLMLIARVMLDAAMLAEENSQIL
ncbi:MAG TPA: hypothetical protein VEB20_19730 [Azospirillaceae bacterium]|nr:hypothetical protein [Azospirillaceae bacterium]